MYSVAAVEARVRMLAADPASVPRARRFASAVAAALLDDLQRHSLELLVTEVVSNAVRHGGTGDRIKLAVTPKDGYVCVQVTDSGSGLVPRPGAMATDEQGGFGLFIVEQLTRRWGMTREDARTRVWFELDFEAAG